MDQISTKVVIVNLALHQFNNLLVVQHRLHQDTNQEVQEPQEETLVFQDQALTNQDLELHTKTFQEQVLLIKAELEQHINPAQEPLIKVVAEAELIKPVPPIKQEEVGHIKLANQVQYQAHTNLGQVHHSNLEQAVIQDINLVQDLHLDTEELLELEVLTQPQHSGLELGQAMEQQHSKVDKVDKADRQVKVDNQANHLPELDYLDLEHQIIRPIEVQEETIDFI